MKIWKGETEFGKERRKGSRKEGEVKGKRKSGGKGGYLGRRRS